MKYNGNQRAMLGFYLLIIGILVIAVGLAGRDVLFDRFTARSAAVVVADGATVYTIGGRSSDGETLSSILRIDSERNRMFSDF